MLSLAQLSGQRLVFLKKMMILTLVCVYRIKGISFISIDQDKPLSEQGPFDVVLHKVCGHDKNVNCAAIALCFIL